MSPDDVDGHSCIFNMIAPRVGSSQATADAIFKRTQTTHSLELTLTPHSDTTDVKAGC